MFKVKLDREFAGSDPAIPIFLIELEDDHSVWRETFGSKNELEHFFKGLVAASHMLGHADIQIPEIPRDDDFSRVAEPDT